MQMYTDHWAGAALQVARDEYIAILRRRLKRAIDREPFMDTDMLWQANNEVITALRGQLEDMEQIG